jgi:SAM-dependent methyltransferase
MAEIDLMKNYPKTLGRDDISLSRKRATKEDIEIARQFGKEYFDGERWQGLGGYYYDPKFFTPVVKDFIEHYDLNNDSSILDIGCGKGFMLQDFHIALPGAKLAGLEISEYCLENLMPSVADNCIFGSCDELPYPDNSFDLVIAIATIHNLDLEGVKKSLKEIQRVSKKFSFLKVNGYKNDNEKKALFEWNLVAKTILHCEDWKKLFTEVGYTGDYYWFLP